MRCDEMRCTPKNKKKKMYAGSDTGLHAEEKEGEREIDFSSTLQIKNY